MKNNLIALAVMAAASAASAQSSVTMFGVVDTGITRGTASGADSGSLTSVSSGGNSTSKLGFRGAEDLGGGMSASFWLEGQLYTDSGIAGREVPAGNQSITTPKGTGMSFTRRSTVSLSGPWGEVRVGRDFTPSLYNITYRDPWANVGVAASIVAVGPATGLNAGAKYGMVPAGQGTSGPISRVSNQISYFTPDIHGFYGQVSYWLGENVKNGALNQDDGTGAGWQAGYRNGPLDASVGWSKTTYKDTPVATTPGAQSGDFLAWNIGGSWNFQVAKIMAMYEHDERQSAVAAQGRGWLLGASVPVGVHELRASFGEYRIDAGTGLVPRTRVFSLGDVYNLSKRTALYVTIARASNKNGARVAEGGATIGASNMNASSTGIDVGIRHNF